MHGFRDAASFLTRVPMHRDGADSAMGAAVPWFGPVGLFIGAIQGAAFVGIDLLTTATLAAALAVAVTTQITGAFHHDGLADMADAFGGGWTPQQRMEILGDSRLGTYGVTALALVLIIEVAALASMSGWVVFAAAVIAHGLSRSMATMAMVTAPAAREGGLGVDYVRDLVPTRVVGSTATLAAATMVLFGVAGVAMVASAALATVAVVRLAIAKIGGISGDVLGGVQQMAKIAVLLVAAVASEHIDGSTLLSGLVLGHGAQG